LDLIIRLIWPEAKEPLAYPLTVVAAAFADLFEEVLEGTEDTEEGEGEAQAEGVLGNLKRHL
jgi:hypothetical protein